MSGQAWGVAGQAAGSGGFGWESGGWLRLAVGVREKTKNVITPAPPPEFRGLQKKCQGASGGVGGWARNVEEQKVDVGHLGNM